ncbi:uncharacterized protein LOC144142165 [Haemaphysalis longicornis]
MKRKEQATNNWTHHRVKILHSYATLQQALRKVEDAEETSNLDSDGNEEPIQKRQKNPHTRGLCLSVTPPFVQFCHHSQMQSNLITKSASTMTSTRVVFSQQCRMQPIHCS